ncbi:hypothetical protein GTY75_04750 [Streptomyces sp. SID8381]|nr:hypothetical protein [Streptomyces sp. SID8381]MYX47377.1 hypothetical protein [Streptomyces sp. SID89]
MPSVTVVVSSDTDIYISPGLYGDCLPTSATGEAADSFRAEHLPSHVSMLVLFMLAHAPGRGQGRTDRAPRCDEGDNGGNGGGRRGVGIHVTSTLWASSK